MNLRDKLRNTTADDAETGAPVDEAPAPAPKRRPVAAGAKKKPAPAAEAPKAGAKKLPKLDVNRRFLMLAGLVAGLAAVMAATYLNNSAAGLSEGGTKVAVLVATVDIDPGVKLTAEMFTSKEIPKAYLPTGYYEKAEDLADRLSIAPMVAGEPIIEKRTSEPNPKYGIAYLLKSGERAKTISVDSAAGLAGLIRPGNEVDLIATIPDPNDSTRRISTPVLQKAKVIAAGDQLLGHVPTDEEGDTSSGISSEGTITLAIPSGKISLVTLLEDLGNLKMVLRSAGDNAVDPPQFSDERIMTLVSGKVPTKPEAVAKPQPADPVSHYVRPAPREVYRPAPRPVAVEQPVAPRPKPKPKPVPRNVEVIHFTGGGTGGGE